jgi:PAS domain S-box-containing protein
MPGGGKIHSSGRVTAVDQSLDLGQVGRSESLLAEAEKLASLGSWEHDLEAGTILQSANLRRMLGSEPKAASITPDSLWRIVDPADHENIRQIIERATNAREPYEYQARFILPDGRKRILLVRGKPIVDSANRVVKRIGVAMDVTERVEFVDAVRESAELYRDLVENSHSLICTHDLSGRLLSMNELPAKILGYSPEELVGRSIPDLLSPERRERWPEYIERIQSEGHATGLLVLRTRSGGRRVWEYHNTLRTQGVPAPVVRGMAHDITERFEAEKNLRRSEALLAQAEGLANIGSWELDIQKQTLHWSKQYYRMLGLEPDSGPVPYGRGIAMIHPEDRERAILDAASLTAGGQEFDNELRFLIANGQERIFHSRAVAEADVSGRVVRVRGMSQDVTERKREEYQLRKSEALLSQAEQMANCGSWEYDPSTQNVTLSRHLKQIFGIRSEDEWKQETYWERIHPHDRERAKRVVEEARREGKPFEHISRFFPREGDMRFHYAKGIPVADATGKPGLRMGVVQDITAQVRAEEDLHKLLRKLLGLRDEDRRRLARQLHESVGQTLAALMMSMGRLRDSLPGQGTLADGFWHSCNELARQAARETREISYSMHPHMLDEAGLGSALRCYARDFADLSGIEVNVDVQPDLVRPSREIETTVFRIVQEALTNVHRHSGSRSASVFVACEDRRLRAEVRDDGCGLPAAISGLRQSHLGVGITGMRERAEQMNGVFELESAPGQGTTVRVTLPLATAP